MKVFTGFEHSDHIPFFLLLTFIGGFVDASSFVIFKVFTGHLTGNSVLSMIYLAQMDWGMLSLSVISLAGFFMGTLSGAWARIKITSPSLHMYMIISVFLLFSIVFILHFFVPSFFSVNLAILMISMSMGIINGYFNKAGSVSIHTTYVTGMTTTCINAMLSNSPGAGKSVLFFAIIAFMLGALSGGYLSVNYQFGGFSCVLILLFAAVVYSAKFRRNCA